MKSCGRMATDSRKMEKDHRISVTELLSRSRVCNLVSSVRERSTGRGSDGQLVVEDEAEDGARADDVLEAESVNRRVL
jgi:hypothetical protein